MQNAYPIINHSTIIPAKLRGDNPNYKYYDEPIPYNLQVFDKENHQIYTLDSGSVVATINNCVQKNIKMDTSRSFTTGYASAQNVVDNLTKETQRILNHDLYAVCDNTPLQHTDDALIGLGVQHTSHDDPNFELNKRSLMSQTQYKRFVVDKPNNTVCLGESCNVRNMSHKKRIVGGNMVLPSFVHDDMRYILDTGSTITSKMNDGVCLIGNADISKLDVNYETSIVGFTANEARIAKICKPEDGFTFFDSRSKEFLN